MFDSCLDTVGGSGVGGWASHVSLVSSTRSAAARRPPLARALYAEVGDWYLRAEHVNSGREVPAQPTRSRSSSHGQAFVELRQGDDASESMAEIFSPELPVTLPTYAPNALASTESSRFIDVAFAITKYGQGEQIEILDSNENATRAEEGDLVRLVKYASFRPP